MTPRSRAMYTDDATNGRQQSTHVRFSCCVNTSRKMACTSEEHARRTFATTIDPASLLLSSTALSSAGAPPMSAPGSTVEAGGAACPRRRSLRLARGDPTATSGALLPATVPARRKLASAPVKSCKANATSAAAISLVRRPAGLPLRTSRSSRSMSASTCCNRTSAAWTDARMVCRAAASRSMHARLRARWARIAATSGDICWETVCMRARQVVNASCNATMLSMAATSRCIRAVCIVAAYSKALFCSDRCCNSSDKLRRASDPRFLCFSLSKRLVLFSSAARACAICGDLMLVCKLPLNRDTSRAYSRCIVFRLRMKSPISCRPVPMGDFSSFLSTWFRLKSSIDSPSSGEGVSVAENELLSSPTRESSVSETCNSSNRSIFTPASFTAANALSAQSTPRSLNGGKHPLSLEATDMSTDCSALRCLPQILSGREMLQNVYYQGGIDKSATNRTKSWISSCCMLERSRFAPGLFVGTKNHSKNYVNYLVHTVWNEEVILSLCMM
eukprot:m.478667 g.478667  ORF g.478667 m.478667 type:complete len:504 (+) comp21694_c0_seq17:294-1805(+)